MDRIGCIFRPVSQLEDNAKQSAIHVLQNLPKKTTSKLALKTPTLPEVEAADPVP